MSRESVRAEARRLSQEASGIPSAGSAPEREPVADAEAVETRGASPVTVRYVMFWLAFVACATCIGIDLAHFRVDGWACLALVAWFVMVGAICTDVEPDPDPGARTSLDERDGI